MILYLWIIGVFIKSLLPVVTASNYSIPFKVNIIFLETFFLLKLTFDRFFNKKIMHESFLGYQFSFSSYIEFVILFIEIFGIQEYSFKTEKKYPIIIDCGSSFGLSIAYFKYFYPHSTILAVEANKRTISFLIKNVEQNHFPSVKILNALASTSSKTQSFYVGVNGCEWTAMDSGVRDYRLLMGKTVVTKVKGIQLSKLITNRIDLLKLDIEGMECEVLDEIKNKLNLVSEALIEYHGSNKLPRNSLRKILDILKKANFDYKVQNTKNWFYQETNFLRIIHAVNKRV